MRQAIRFPGGSIACQRNDRALSDEVRGRLVLVQVAKTGASASREWSSCEGFGSLAFMYTTKWVSLVKSDTCPFASRRLAQWAQDSISSRIARPFRGWLGVREMQALFDRRWCIRPRPARVDGAGLELVDKGFAVGRDVAAHLPHGQHHRQRDLEDFGSGC
jgi:hypothetical protein